MKLTPHMVHALKAIYAGKSRYHSSSASALRSRGMVRGYHPDANVTVKGLDWLWDHDHITSKPYGERRAELLKQEQESHNHSACVQWASGLYYDLIETAHSHEPQHHRRTYERLLEMVETYPLHPSGGEVSDLTRRGVWPKKVQAD